MPTRTRAARLMMIERLLGPGNRSKVARQTKMSQSHINRVLRGVCEPSLFAAAEIAKVTRLSLDEVFAYYVRQRDARRAEAASYVAEARQRANEITNTGVEKGDAI